MELRPRAKSAIAKRFKTFRQRSLMSQAQLGHVIEICRQAVNRIENGRAMPHYTTLERFRNLEVRHEQARALSRTMATEFRPR
jgi:DNA-binding XRE family transcriptional regulator